MTQKIRFTTSWDDGSIQDLKLCALLNKYGIKGTFYVSKEFVGYTGKYSEFGRCLNTDEIREIATAQEIGAHGLRHCILTTLDQADLTDEVLGSKKYLEEASGKEIKMFCYPGGKFDERVIAAVKDAGFIGARTTAKLRFGQPEDPFRLDVGILAAPFPFRKTDAHHYNWRRLLDPVQAYGWSLAKYSLGIPKMLSWGSYAGFMLDKAKANGGYFHVYGHSWELEKYGLWDELEDFFRIVANRSDVICLTNSGILEI